VNWIGEAFAAPARQSSSLEETAHRPWPLPEQSWVMGQTWDDLLFAHWRVDADAVRALIPAGLELDLYEDEAWLGVTPFVVTGLRARGLPPFPFVSSFPELNTRTYVTLDGKPGIWFFSLDAASDLAVEGARRGYKLPYFGARMSAVWRDGRVAYESRRRDPRGPAASFRGQYRPDGAAFQAEDGTLEHFLTERYCLYALDDDELKRAEIHHRPWPLQPAEASIEENTMPPPGVELADDEPLLHYSARQDVVIWPLEDA
jgi:uncharacterized protein YqjF (DUF2071 family)